MLTMKNLLLSAGLVFAGIVAGQSIASAQCTPDYPPPPGTPTECVIVNGEKVWIDAYGNPVPGQSEGGATFIAGEQQKQPCGTTQEAESFDVTVRTKELGAIRTTLDRERQPKAPATRIVSQQADAPFPASAEINVYLLAESDAFPGQVFRSADVVTLTSDKIQSFPFKEEVFVLKGKTEFVNEEGKVGFTLAETKVVLHSRR